MKWRLVALAAAASLCVAGAASARTISFSGTQWLVKNSSGKKWGPGPNVFSGSTDSVWVDAAGRLHLRISQQNGVWTCAEVIAKQSFGYGTYRFYLDSPVNNLDPRAVLGLFTWSDAPDYEHREIDVELSRWNGETATNAQFVVQPFDTPGRLHRFDVPGLPQTIQSFTWLGSSVAFSSIAGADASTSDAQKVIQQWVYKGGMIPKPGSEYPHINLWLYQGKAPKQGMPVEVIVQKFEFVPPSGLRQPR